MQAEMSHLLDCISHFLEMRLLVKVAGHFLGYECFGYICCTEQDPAAKGLHITLHATQLRATVQFSTFVTMRMQCSSGFHCIGRGK